MTRTRGPPKRLQNEQARSAEATATRKRKRSNTPATRPSTVRGKPKTAVRPKVNPKSKLLNTLAKLRNTEAPNSGLKRYGYTFLASLYRNHPSTQLAKYANWSNEKQIEFMKKQHSTLVKKTSRINATSETVNIPMNDEKMHDLLIMLWMDMSHDKLFKGSFNAFLTSSIKNEITKKKIPPKKTELVSKLESYEMLKISNGDIVLATGIETKLKKHMHDIWGDPSYPPKLVKKTASILSIVKNVNKPIYVSYDAENADYITELLAKSRMNSGTYYLKRIFTVANLMDPGRGASANVGGFGKSGGSINKLVNRLFDEQSTSTPFKFNYQMFKFNFENYFTIEIVPDGSKFNAKLNGKMLNMQVKRTDALNGNELDKISKTFGDFIQIITVAHLRESGLNVVSSTQDGGFVGMTGFVQGTLFGIEPALISDSTTVIGTGNITETGIKFYGLHNYLKYNTEPTRSGVTTQLKNNKSNVSNSNPRQRNVGTVGVNPKQGFFRRFFGGKSPKFKPQTPKAVNNTTSFVTASSNNSNNNNNNVTQSAKKRKVSNNVISNNRRGVKRTRNNINNVSQPNPKRVNTNRNKLIQNLKKKNLPSYAMIGLIRNYDNNKRTANQTIREANSFGQTFKMGQTAQRKSTFRPR
jgi:hypothetical protein